MSGLPSDSGNSGSRGGLRDSNLVDQRQVYARTSPEEQQEGLSLTHNLLAECLGGHTDIQSSEAGPHT